MAKRLIPSFNRVLIEKIVPPTKTNSGILLPESTSKVKSFSLFLFFSCWGNCWKRDYQLWIFYFSLIYGVFFSLELKLGSCLFLLAYFHLAILLFFLILGLAFDCYVLFGLRLWGLVWLGYFVPGGGFLTFFLFGLCLCLLSIWVLYCSLILLGMDLVSI